MSYRQSQEQIRSELTQEQADLFRVRDYKGTTPIADAFKQGNYNAAISTNASIEDYYYHNRNYKMTILKILGGVGACKCHLNNFSNVCDEVIHTHNLPFRRYSAIFHQGLHSYIYQRAPLMAVLVFMWYNSNISPFEMIPDLYDPSEPVQ